MLTRTFSALPILALLTTSLHAQPTPAFLAADVHPSPHRSYPFFYAVLLKQDRYIVRDATMVDLIATAWGLDPLNVQGGPPWLGRDRFDIIAKVAPPGASKPDQRLMLRALLKDRFQVTFHEGSTPMPAFSLTAVNGKSKLKPAEGAGEFTCENPDQPGPLNLIKCRNATLDDIALQLHNMAGAYFDHPIINSTSLQGTYDFELRWTDRGGLEKAGSDGISVFTAVEKQLGLKLTLETAPRPVILVDSVTEMPTPNPADTATILPPPPPPRFEVATIKPSRPGEDGNGRIDGGIVNFTNIRLKDMIDLAWDLNENDPDVLVGAPKSVSDLRFDILAKVTAESTGKAAAGDLPMDIYEVQLMLQALLIERFNMKAHMEDRPINAYTLLAPNSKLKPAADPTARTLCKEGPGPDGKDPRLTSPILNRLLTCRNISMPQIAEELQRFAGGYIFGPVLDKTGLKGAYDFTLSFSSAGRVLPNAQVPADGSASDPSGGVSLFDAVSRQLGLKLEKEKRPMPVLVIEHMDEKPTEN